MERHKEIQMEIKTDMGKEGEKVCYSDATVVGCRYCNSPSYFPLTRLSALNHPHIPSP